MRPPEAAPPGGTGLGTATLPYDVARPESPDGRPRRRRGRVPAGDAGRLRLQVGAPAPVAETPDRPARPGGLAGVGRPCLLVVPGPVRLTPGRVPGRPTVLHTGRPGVADADVAPDVAVGFRPPPLETPPVGDKGTVRVATPVDATRAAPSTPVAPVPIGVASETATDARRPMAGTVHGLHAPTGPPNVPTRVGGPRPPLV